MLRERSLQSLLHRIVINFINKSPPIQAAIFLLILVFISFGRIARWDLLEQIAMSDNSMSFGEFYPSPDKSIPSGVSVYFPGLALLATALRSVVPTEYIIHAMLLVAITVTVVFLIIQKFIAKQISETYNSDNYQELAIIFALVLLKDWLTYALEFKPDTIAFCLGYIGIIISGAHEKGDINKLNFMIGAGVAGFALIFKQQYISFLLGILAYSVFRKNRKLFHFAVLSLSFSVSVIFAIYCHSKAWFWTVTVLSDDGFISPRQWLGDHFKMAIVILSFFILLYGVQLFLKFKPNKFTHIPAVNIFFDSPWLTIMLFSSAASFASAFKVGGNSGNSALGLILLLPLIGLLFQGVNRHLLILVTWTVLLLQAAPVYRSVARYNQVADLNKAVVSLAISKDARVLTGSNVYGAARNIRTSAPIENYWAKSARDDTHPTQALNTILSSTDFDYLIVENMAVGKSVILETGLYEIIFENDIGIVAKTIVPKHSR